jgi:competence protein ComEC
MLGGGVRSLIENFAEERDRWFLWAPVLMGTGIALYFGLPIEPEPWIGLVAVAACLVGLAGARAHPDWSALLVAIMACCAGFSAAQLRTAMVAAPMLADDIGRAVVSGRIDEVNLLPEGRRIVLRDVVIAGLDPSKTPEAVRVRIMGTGPDLRPGARVSLRADLGSPSAPVMPGGYDFQRDAYFKGIGAVGFAFGARVEILGTSGDGWRHAWSEGWSALRLSIAERIRATLPGATGAIAVALVTGDQGGIPKQVLENMRDSGLAHLLSISGLHIGLVAGLLFLGIRGALALVPRVALYHPIKKWAAAFALMGTFFYVMLAGATVPTQRSFVMTALVLLAVMFDRTALSMRTVAWAALVVLTLRPEALVGPSFQMSFAAVVALIAIYETSEDWRAKRRAEAGWIRRLALNAGGIAATSLVATLATSPFAVFHFNRLAGYGVAANMLAVPITGLWVMAWGILAVCLMPIGMESVALIAMGWGIDAIIAIADLFAHLPGSAALVPAMPLAGLIAITIGGLWLCLWRRSWRWWGVAGVAAGMASVAATTPPDLLISGDGQLFAVRSADGDYMLSSRRAHRFDSESWLRQAGLEEGTSIDWSGSATENRPTCDSLGCIHRISGVTIAIEIEPEALFDDCRVADIIVSRHPVRIPCPSARYVVDRFDLWREGAHALWVFDDGGFEVVSVADRRGERPWVIKRGVD